MHGELVAIYHRAVHGFLCIYASICKKNITSDGYFYTVIII